MKLYKTILAFAAILCVAASCEKELEVKKLYAESDFVAPAITAPGEIDLTTSVLSQDSPIAFTWSAADFGQPAEIVYNINAAYSGNSTVLFAKLNGVSYSVKPSELYDKLVNLGVPKGQKVNVVFNMDCTIGSDFTTLKSADKTISVQIAE